MQQVDLMLPINPAPLKGIYGSVKRSAELALSNTDPAAYWRFPEVGKLNLADTFRTSPADTKRVRRAKKMSDDFLRGYESGASYLATRQPALASVPLI